MKLKLLVVAVVVIVGLYFLNHYLGHEEGIHRRRPRGRDAASGEVREHFTSGSCR